LEPVPRDEAGQTGRSVRWLLLACTLFGLAAMHTIGHGGMHLEAAGHHPAAMAVAMPGAISAETAAGRKATLVEPAAVPEMTWAVPAAGPGVTPTVLTAMTGASWAEPAGAGGCDGGCAHGPGSGPHDGMAGWSVCLAVLGAVATLILLAMLVMPSRRRERPASVADPWAVVSRGPPVRSAGLAVAAVSVLRI
jgi:hypothetical protein